MQPNLPIGLLLAFSLLLGTALHGLPAPGDPADLAALGLPEDSGPFSIEDLPGRQVVLIFFDLYCPVCQKSASNKNRLWDAIRSMNNPVVLLGVGYGDTAFEVGLFQKKFEVEFPCVPDREKTEAARLGINKTPAVLVLERPEAQGDFQEIYRREGYFGREHVKAVLRQLGP
jgi:peroxiredoxin